MKNTIINMKEKISSLKQLLNIKSDTALGEIIGLSPAAVNELKKAQNSRYIHFAIILEIALSKLSNKQVQKVLQEAKIFNEYLNKYQKETTVVCDTKSKYEIRKKDKIIFQSNNWNAVISFISKSEEKLFIEFKTLSYPPISTTTLYEIVAKFRLNHLRHITLRNIHNFIIDNEY